MAETAPATDHTPAVDAGPESASAPIAGSPRGESRTVRLYRAALGPVNTDSYLAVFERFDAVGRRWMVWHPVAGFFTWSWLVFRRLWAEAAVYGLLWLVFAGGVLWAWPVLQAWPPGVRWGLLGFLLLLSVLLPGLAGYGLVHRQVQRRALRAVAAANTMDEARSTLSLQAASVNRLWAVVAAQGLVLAALTAAWLGGFWPSAGLEKPSVPPVAPVAAAASGAETPPAAVAEVPAPATPSAATPPEPPVNGTVAAAESTGTVTSTGPTQTVFLAVAPGAGTSSTTNASTGTSTTVTEVPAASEPSKAYAINVGLFAVEANAQRAQARLQAAGLPVVVQVINTSKGPRTRVRVGPFPQREAADAAAEQIRQLGLEAVVFDQ